ncbi:MAG: hypothetical protein U0R26_02840 [Solirubrobacterales bacterium]
MRILAGGRMDPAFGREGEKIPGGAGDTGISVAAQAGRKALVEFLLAAYARLLEMRQRWRIAGIDWFTWQDVARPDPRCAFCEGAGLLDLSGRPKPAWWAFRQTMKAGAVR